MSQDHATALQPGQQSETVSKRRKKEKGWELFYANGNQKRAGVAILIAGKIDFNTKSIRRDKECYYVMKKESIQQEDIRI